MARCQFQLRETLIVGVQEARTPQGARRKGDDYVIASGHVAHTAGVELWLNLQQPYGHCRGKPLHFMPRHAFVLYAAPRMLVVRVQAPGLELVICVAHAMHRDTRLQKEPSSGKPLMSRCRNGEFSSCS
eukprot:8226843-Pyramimonas_sp.AAC.1